MRNDKKYTVDELFDKVNKTIGRGEIMSKKEPDGIYIRLAGVERKGGINCAGEWHKIIDFDKYFIQPQSEVKEKEYEIISSRQTESSNSKVIITSVKRLSDDMIFSLGDMVYWNPSPDYYAEGFIGDFYISTQGTLRVKGDFPTTFDFPFYSIHFVTAKPEEQKELQPVYLSPKEIERLKKLLGLAIFNV